MFKFQLGILLYSHIVLFEFLNFKGHCRCIKDSTEILV